MHFTITTKLFHLSDIECRYIERLVKKLLQFAPWKEPDLPLLEIVVRKHKKKSLNHIEKRLISEGTVEAKPGHETIDNPIYYDGTLDLILPKKRIVAKMLGKTVREALKDGFDELFLELDKYKGMHFANDSEYHSHKTIRQK